MLRKLSTRFRSKKEDVNGVNGTNGTTHSVPNGTNGESKAKPNLRERHSSFTPFKSKKDTSNYSVDHNASRQDVEDSFEQFAQLIHASVRILSLFLIDQTLQSSRMAPVKTFRASFLNISFGKNEAYAEFMRSHDLYPPSLVTRCL